jgi:hypothetical protein
MTTKPKVATAEEWGGSAKKDGAGVHYPLLPSGVRVKFRIPDLPELIAAGNLPNELVDVAIKVAQGNKEVSREAIDQQPKFYRFVIENAVLEPPITDELYKKLPVEDKEMIVALATRQTDLDAEYHHLGGLDKSDRWRKFRGLDDLIADVEGAEGV